MAFKLATERKFKSKITIRMPNENGTVSLMTFTAIFKAMKISEATKMQETNPELPILKEVLVGFEDVQNEDGTPVEWSEEARDLLIDEPLVQAELLRTYYRETTQGRQKN